MKTLPITALQVDTLYRCALSNQVVLVTNITEHAGVKQAEARYFNHSTGQYEVMRVRDHQLNVIPERGPRSGGPAHPGSRAARSAER